MHSSLYEAVATKTIQLIVDGKRSSSGVLTWRIIEGWFADNGGNSMVTERAMNDLETLVLSENGTAEDYIALFTDIMERLDMAKSSLLPAHQVRSFIKDIIDPLYLPVVSKVRDMLTDGSKVMI